MFYTFKSRSSPLSLVLIMTIVLALRPRFTNGSATEDDFLRLYDKLTSNYSRHMRPVRNQSAPVHLDIGFTMFSILEIKDTENQVDFLSLIQVNWNDHNLVWNPQDYGGINRMWLSEDQIWAPKVSQFLNAQSQGFMWDIPTSHEVSSSGSVNFANAAYRSLFCELDMTYFPYDYQLCKMEIQLSDANAKEVDFSKISARISPTFAQNREWLLEQVSPAVTYYGSPADLSVLFTVHMILKRRPTFSNFNIVVPAIIINMLCMLTFFVPVECGERLSYSLTTLLSLSVYITYIGGFVPSSSNPVPILFEFIVSLFMICAICVVLTLLVIKVRWSRVQKSFDNQKYVIVFGLRINLSGRRWFNKIDAIDHVKHDVENLNRATVIFVKSINEPQSQIGQKSTLEKGSQSQKSISETNARRGNVEKDLNLDHFSTNATTYEENGDVDSALINLCKSLDLASFSLACLTFMGMSLFTVTKFCIQDKPVIPA